MNLRACARLAWLGAELARAAADFVFLPAVPTLRERALWQHRAAGRVARVLHLRLKHSGQLPQSGLLVCNHLSYLDIILLSCLTPAIFVAKSDVRQWPVFGWFARRSGTIFAQRDRRMQAGDANQQIAQALADNALVVLFPEGTSSDGRDVLPFKSSLLESGARAGGDIFVGRIRYELDDGDVGEEVCYWKDHVLAPHLFNLLGKREVRGHIFFARADHPSPDRKILAQQLRAQILALGPQETTRAENHRDATR